MSYHCVSYRVDDGVAEITLNRPEVLNSLNKTLSEELLASLSEATKDESVRVLILKANGNGFCAGQDIKEFIGDNAVTAQEVLEQRLNKIVLAIRNCPKPVVCAVQGVAAGAGASLAICCDIVLASDEASFIQAFVKIGVVPDSGATYYLPRLVGTARASALALLGDKLSAKQAADWGLIYRSVPAENLPEEVRAVAKTLRGHSSVALQLTKEALAKSHSNNLVDQLSLEVELQGRATASPEHIAAVKAFTEKRTS